MNSTSQLILDFGDQGVVFWVWEYSAAVRHGYGFDSGESIFCISLPSFLRKWWVFAMDSFKMMKKNASP